MPKHLDELTKKELLELAKKEQIRRYSSMTKAELIEALEKAGRGKKQPARVPAAEKKMPEPEAEKAVGSRPTRSRKARKTAAREEEKEEITLEEKQPAARKTVGKRAKPSRKGEEKAAAPSLELPKIPKPEPETRATIAKYQTRASGTHEHLLDEWAELPSVYGENRIALIPIDPRWLHAYWELTGEAVAEVKSRGGVRPLLRLYDVTDVVFDGTNAHGYSDFERAEWGNSWYFHVPAPQRSYLVDIGYLTADGRLLVLARSNAALTPSAAPSPVIEEHFVTIPVRVPLSAIPVGEERPLGLPAVGLPAVELPPREGPVPVKPAPAAAVRTRPEVTPAVREIYERLGVPLSQKLSIPVGSEIWQLGPFPGLEEMGGASELISSWGWGSEYLAVSSLEARPPGRERERGFWLVADTELIVYGATEPDARVTVQGRPVTLRPDGTFTLRFALPDGIQDIPIHAVAADGEQERGITFVVQRQTTRGKPLD